MADAIVIGWQMGVTGLAALCFSLPLHTMLLAFVHGLGLGGSTRYARLLAEGKPAQATDCFNRVLQAGLAVSVLLAALVNLFPQAILELLGTTPADGTLYTAAKGYLCLIASGAPLFLLKYVLNDFLRSDDNRRLATRGSLYGNAIRIALDLVLVPGLGMGTAGAAGATLIGLSVSVLCYMPALFAKDRTLHLAAARPNPRETLSCLKSGLPAAAPYPVPDGVFPLCQSSAAAPRGGKRRGGFRRGAKHRVSDFVHIHRCCQGGAAAVPNLLR